MILSTVGGGCRPANLPSLLQRLGKISQSDLQAVTCTNILNTTFDVFLKARPKPSSRETLPMKRAWLSLNPHPGSSGCEFWKGKLWLPSGPQALGPAFTASSSKLLFRLLFFWGFTEFRTFNWKTAVFHSSAHSWCPRRPRISCLSPFKTKYWKVGEERELLWRRSARVSERRLSSVAGGEVLHRPMGELHSLIPSVIHHTCSTNLRALLNFHTGSVTGRAPENPE